VLLTIDGDSFTATAGASWCIPCDAVHGAEILEDAIAIEIFSPVRADYLPPTRA
jgi:quercetin dioxygenase-like cupin family protein